jgi:GNAT superfamily N-acetyltransferase
MQIREAKQSDLKAIMDLFEELNKEHNAALPQIFRKAGRESIEWYLFSIFGNFNAAIFVAEDEEFLGFIHVTIEQVKGNPLFENRTYAWVHNLLVKKDMRRKGIGRALMQKAQEWGSLKGATSTELTVWEFNEEALRFYDALGYVTLNRHLIKKSENKE